jgi:pimeloyl-ACP methyl ester carboxylesterase
LLANYFSRLIDILNLDSTYLMGWSHGGIAAYLLAADLPVKIKRIITVEAQFGSEGYTDETFEFFINLSPEVVKQYRGTWVDNYEKLVYEKNTWERLIILLSKMWKQEVFVPSEKIEKMKCRSLIYLGDQDAISLEHGLKMYNIIEGSEFLVLPNTGHMVFYEKPDLVKELGLEFLLRP